ncbi:MAG: hypothetical protein JW863_05350 [Chitinispirillaceae bacterium]|nr:hypothetical protein [Chitinispirillaceae bacterium]
MTTPRILTLVAIALVCRHAVASGNDSATATPPPDTAGVYVTEAVTGSIAIPDTLAAFSVLQKKYLKTAIITNSIYAGGMGLLYGVVMPRMAKADGVTEQLKLLPLNYLAMGMLYASLPIGIVSSHRAEKNYRYYYKSAPRNISLPLTFTGAGFHIGSFGVSIWQILADYRDNHEMDGSYSKYGDVSLALFNAGLITFACTNLYSLAYTIILGEKANRHPDTTANASIHLAPLRYGDANGFLLAWDF